MTLGRSALAVPLRLALVVLAALTLALMVTQLHPYLGDYGDDAEFVILGQGLATGQGYAWVNSPDRPAHNRYPPGYPALVAAGMLVTGTSGDAFRAIVPTKVATALTFIAALVLLWRWARRRLPPAWALGAVALFALNPVGVRFAVQAMSDVPYVPALLGALLWAERIRRDDRSRSWLVLGLLLAVGAYLRSIGLAAAAGVLLWAWIAAPRRQAAVATGAFVLAMLPWWLRDAALAGGWRYLEELMAANYQSPQEGTVGAGGLAARALDNAAFVLGKPAAFGPLGVLAGAIGAGLLALGGVRSARTGGGAAELAALAICLSVLLWPIKTGRYLLPVIPLAGVYAVLGSLAARDWLAPRLQLGAASRPDGAGSAGALARPDSAAISEGGPTERLLSGASAAGLVLVCLGFTAYGARESGRNLQALRRGADPASYYADRPEWTHYVQAADWLRANTGPADVAMARRHFALYVYSGRYVEKYRFDTSPEELAYLTAGTAQKYVVEDTFDYLRGDFDALPVALRQRGGDLRLRFSTDEPSVRVWELVRPR